MRREELCEIIEELCYNFGIMMGTDDYVYELIGPAKKCKVEVYAPVDDPAEDPLANPPVVESCWFKSYKSLADELIKLNTMVVACGEDLSPDYKDIDWYEVIEGYEGMRNEDPSVDLQTYFEFLFGENWARAALAYSEWEENLDVEEEPLNEEYDVLGEYICKGDSDCYNDDWDPTAGEFVDDISSVTSEHCGWAAGQAVYWFGRYCDAPKYSAEEKVAYDNYIAFCNLMGE